MRPEQMRNLLCHLLLIASLVGCQSGRAGSAGNEEILHVHVANEMTRSNEKNEPDHSIHLRVFIDGEKKIDGVYQSDGLYNPVTFQFALPRGKHDVRVEVPGQTGRTFVVPLDKPIWASVLFGWEYGERQHIPFTSYQLSDHFMPAF